MMFSPSHSALKDNLDLLGSGAAERVEQAND
jgi:hypothetical protein